MTQPATGRSPEDLVHELRDRVDSSPHAMQSVRLILLSLYQWTGECPSRDEHVRDTIARLTAATNRIIIDESPIHAEVKLKLNQDVKVRFDNDLVVHTGQLTKIRDGYQVLIPVEDPPTFAERFADEIRDLATTTDPAIVLDRLHAVVSEELRTIQTEVRHLVDDQLGGN
jgi:hypothetical protein